MEELSEEQSLSAMGRPTRVPSFPGSTHWLHTHTLCSPLHTFTWAGPFAWNAILSHLSKFYPPFKAQLSLQWPWEDFSEFLSWTSLCSFLPPSSIRVAKVSLPYETVSS